MKRPLFFALLAAGGITASVVCANTAPEVVIQSAAMRPGTTLMDVVYRVNDPDDATVRTRALAFVDGVRSFSNVIRPVTFAEGTAVNLGDAVATNVDHTLTWDVATDWDIDLGQVKFEVLAIDARGLLPFDWLTIPAAGGVPEMTISANAPTDAEVLDAYFWLYASGDVGLALTEGVVRGTSAGGLFEGIGLVAGTGPLSYATPYLLKQMDLATAGRTAVNHAVAARSSISNPDEWHAIDGPWRDIDLVVGWGGNSSGPEAGSGLDDIVDIVAGGGRGAVRLSDGTVVDWGSGPVAPPLTGVVDISLGLNHGLAALADGTVVGWGNDSNGQATPPEGLADVTAVETGAGFPGRFSLALLGNGTVVGWGDNFGDRANPPAGLGNVTAIAAGGMQSLALLADRTVVAWGRPPYPPAGLANVTAIAAGERHGLALLENGTVVAWGASPMGIVPDGLANVTAIAAGDVHSLALLADGTVVSWGDDSVVVPPADLDNVSFIAAGRGISYAVIKATP